MFNSIQDFTERLSYLMACKGVDEYTLSQKTNLNFESISHILSGEDSPSVEEICSIAQALNTSPASLFLENHNILDKLDITVEEFQWSMENNPSLRGVVIGYLAELKLRQFFENDRHISNLFKYDDHDRKKKSDLVVVYNGKEYSFESKSLQTNTVKNSSVPGIEKIAKFQCDASDCRDIELPDGDKLKTTLLKYGEFDILAVNMFAFHGKWEYAFARNKDLPHSTSKKYTESQQKQLISSLITITYPVQPPFVLDPFVLLEEIEKEK